MPVSVYVCTLRRKSAPALLTGDGIRTTGYRMTESPGSRLRQLLTRPEILVAPGAYDAITARLVQACGFEAVYVTGGGTTNAYLGLPDVGLMTLTEMAGIVGRIANVTEVPVLCDADTGYGTPLNVMRTVVEFERAGAAGLHIEDQSGVKRCGHLSGKALISITEMTGKVKAACAARRDPGFVVMARTDAAAIEGLTGALERAHAYAEAGADAIFIEALQNQEQFAEFAKSAPTIPILANMTEFGNTDLINVRDFQAMGYACVIFPMTSFRLMLGAVDGGLREIAATGTQRGLLDRMKTRKELYELIDYDYYQRYEQDYVPTSDF